MKAQEIKSLKELKYQIDGKKKAYLLLYKSGSEQSDCAIRNLGIMEDPEELPLVIMADVREVRDIHPEFGITTVPSMLEFEEGHLKNVVKGCQNPDVLKSLFDEAVYIARMEKEGKTVKYVTVYSSPTCSWCNTLKNYLRQNKIRFTDVDVSRDPDAARNLINRTGQQGVPQTEIDGQWVVGFDQIKINQLLEINPHS